MAFFRRCCALDVSEDAVDEAPVLFMASTPEPATRSETSLRREATGSTKPRNSVSVTRSSTSLRREATSSMRSSISGPLKDRKASGSLMIAGKLSGALKRSETGSTVAPSGVSSSRSSTSTSSQRSSTALVRRSTSHLLGSSGQQIQQEYTLDMCCGSYVGRYVHGESVEQDFVLEDTVLGEGMSGAVLLATHRNEDGHRNDGRHVAVKRFDKESMSPEALDDMRRETELFLDMDHPFVCRLERVYENDAELSLVMECLSGGDVFDRLASVGRFTEADAAPVVQQMLFALGYIHKKGLVHGDIKPENYVYEDESCSRIKLIDFGLTKAYDGKNRILADNGTLDYAAPEVLTMGYTDRADIWSIAVSAYVLLTGEMLWPQRANDEDRRDLVIGGKPRFSRRGFEPLSHECRSFIRCLLEKDDSKRPSALEALRHPWFVRQCGKPQQLSSCSSRFIAGSLRGFAATPPLFRACAVATVWSLSKEKRAQLQQHFLDFDEDKSGTLSGDDGWRLFRQYGLPDEEVEAIFAKLDQDKAGYLKYTEFLAITAASSGGFSDTELDMTFHRFDVHGNGYVDVEGLREVLGGVAEEAVASWGLQDHDGEKYDDLSFDGFVEFMRLHSQQASKATVPEARSMRAWMPNTWFK